MKLSSEFIQDGKSYQTSKLIKATQDWGENLKSYSIEPKGMFGRKAIIRSGNVVIRSSELDVEFTVRFDDDMEANESEIIVYNLSSSTISMLKYHADITIEAGYNNDIGVIFKGYITKVSTTYSGADKITTIKTIDDFKKRTLENLTFSKNTRASSILRNLINKTGIPVACFQCRRDHVYEDEQNVDGDLMENIKKYAQVCGISVYVNKGKVYARHIKIGDNISFTVSENTGMINSPSAFSEEITAEDFKETVNGYEIEMLLQHRMTTAAIINLSSLVAKGQYRVKSGEHTFNEQSAITKIKVI